MTAIKTYKLTKKYKDVTALAGLDLEVEHGELFGLLGVNGAGKTTTVKILSCLVRPTSGDATVYGKSILNDEEAVKSVIGVSPQETAVAPNLTVMENMELMCGIHGLADGGKRADELINSLGLGDVKNKRAGKLSGGKQRSLSLAMALVAEPKLLFLDEPTLGLDVIARSELWDIIKALKGSTTIILTTHYMEEAEALCDRIGIMKDGRMLICDTAENIKAHTGAQRFDDAFVKVVKEG